MMSPEMAASTRTALTTLAPGGGCRLVAGTRGDDQLRRGELPGELCAELVIDVDHAQSEPRPRKETRLRVGVGRHGAVIVEMIAREIGERRGMEPHTADAMLIERMRRHFHAHHLGAELPHRGEAAVNGHRIVGGVLRRGEHAREAEPDRPHVGGGPLALAERLRQEPRAGRLAVRAGDAGDRHRLRGLAEEPVGDDSGVLGELRNRSDEHVVSAARQAP